MDKVPAGEIYKYQNEIQSELTFSNPLKLTEKEISVDGAYEFGPAEFLARKWFPETRFADSIEQEQAVAREAIRRGYDGIIYGDNEIQDLRDLIKKP